MPKENEKREIEEISGESEKETAAKIAIRLREVPAEPTTASSRKIRLSVQKSGQQEQETAEVQEPAASPKQRLTGKDIFWSAAWGLWTFLRWVYLIGIQTIRILKRVGRRIGRFLRPVSQPLALFLYFHLIRPFRLLRQSARSTNENLVRGVQNWKKAFHTGFSSVLHEFLKLLGILLHILQKALFWAVNIAAPAAAIVLLVITFHQWSNVTYGLAVQYQGKLLGYVKSEDVVSEAVNLAEQKLQAYAAQQEDKTFEFDSPTYTLASVGTDDYYLSANSICTAIVSSVDTNQVEAAGLYVDGELIGAVKSPIDLKFILQQILDQNVDPNDSSMTAAFVQDVTVQKGTYSAALVMDSDAMQGLLTSTQEVQQTYTVKEGDAPLSIASKLGVTLTQLQSLNPDRDLRDDVLRVGDKLVISGERGYLTIRQVRQETYTREVAYDVETEKTGSLYVGTSNVVQKGEKGVTSYTDLVTYVDGMEVARENVATEVVQEPVKQVVQVGTKEYNTTQTITTNAVTSGTYIWPVPGNYIISKSYGYYGGSLHSAIDIQANAGTPIVATASGTVTSAGWNSGYGYNMTIQHDDGTASFYAHCSKLFFSAGTHVAQGQTIALVGMTGTWATGNHLHFSLIINGAYVNPYGYLTK